MQQLRFLFAMGVKPLRIKNAIVASYWTHFTTIEFLILYFASCMLHVWFNVTGPVLVGHRLDTTWAKVLKLCYQMTTEVDLLFEAATTIVCTAEPS